MRLDILRDATEEATTTFHAQTVDRRHNKDNCRARGMSSSETGWMQSGPSYFAELTIVERREHPLALPGRVSAATGLRRKLFEKQQAIALRLPVGESRAYGCE